MALRAAPALHARIYMPARARSTGMYPLPAPAARPRAKGRNFGLAVKWTETVSRCFNTYAVRPPVYSVIY
eukprot:COSAG02_NODE_18473_length_936_cov_1.158901_1_plen_69_part_10